PHGARRVLGAVLQHAGQELGLRRLPLRDARLVLRAGSGARPDGVAALGRHPALFRSGTDGGLAARARLLTAAGVGAGAVLGAGLAGGAGRAAALLPAALLPAALVSAAGRLLAAWLVAAALLLAFLVAGSPAALLAGLAGVAALVTAVGRDALEVDLVGLAASLPGCGRALRARDRAGPVVASRLLGLRWGSGLG